MKGSEGMRRREGGREGGKEGGREVMGDAFFIAFSTGRSSTWSGRAVSDLLPASVCSFPPSLPPARLPSHVLPSFPPSLPPPSSLPP